MLIERVKGQSCSIKKHLLRDFFFLAPPVFGVKKRGGEKVQRRDSVWYTKKGHNSGSCVGTCSLAFSLFIHFYRITSTHHRQPVHLKILNAKKKKSKRVANGVSARKIPPPLSNLYRVTTPTRTVKGNYTFVKTSWSNCDGTTFRSQAYALSPMTNRTCQQARVCWTIKPDTMRASRGWSLLFYLSAKPARRPKLKVLVQCFL